MCVPGCHETVVQNLDRRAFLKGGLIATAAAATGCHMTSDSRIQSADRIPFPGFEQIIDLTYTYSDRFPHFAGGTAHLTEEEIVSTESGVGWNTSRWTLDEHAGTHVDVPYHRHADGVSIDKIPVENLVLPLVVIDIQEKASQDADAEVTADDVRKWESLHGPVPERACVAMLSGWESRVMTPGFINFDADKVRHFPGFHLDAAAYLLEKRGAVALAVDTASFDHGPSTEFPVHTMWLTEQRWALENAAGLDRVPPRGATICCGMPKLEGASGGPSRVLAFV